MNTWSAVKKYKHCYLWISPFYILFGVFSVAPAVYGLMISFTNYSGFGAYKSVGFANYEKLFRDALFWKSLGNTAVLWALIVPLRTFLALLFASILNSKRLIGRRIYSVVVLLPYVTAVVVVASVFRIMFATEGGLVNVLLGDVLGLGPVNWLDSTAWSKTSVALMNIWRMTGYFSLVMLAGMQKISTSVNEAAELDGANDLQKFFRITLPLLKPEIFFVALMSTIWIFQNIGDVMILTGGGPLNSSLNLVLYIYRNAYEFSKVGYASAMSYMLFLILMALSAFSVRGHFRGKGGAQ